MELIEKLQQLVDKWTTYYETYYDSDEYRRQGRVECAEELKELLEEFK